MTQLLIFLLVLVLSFLFIVLCKFVDAARLFFVPLSGFQIDLSIRSS